ncbi:Peptide chain release factor N(5)-glutamine methyltransferase [[Mycoplasma] cavipharyngis]|uniref:N5-glutamine methyltransferase family protein n=1 Tax=[Mycoplasma] cavipharyngis TaxID=92757 RepID=UPI0037043363
MKLKTNLQLINAAEKFCHIHHKDPLLALEILYFLSSKIKNLIDYVELMHQPIDVNQTDYQTILNQVCLQNIPLARIFKKTYFYHRLFIVNDQVFIPRQETELVVKTLIDQIKNYHLENDTYLDLCTGTGIIAITTKLAIPQLKEVVAVDLSTHACINARINCEQHQTAIKVIEADWYQFLLKHHSFDIISANFPYVGINDPIANNLLANEPHLALFAENDGWSFYQLLLDFLSTYEKQSKWKIVVLETSAYHYKQWAKVQQQFKNWDFELIYDFNQHLRVVVIRSSLLKNQLL